MSENTGQGSSGSWRADDTDTTKAFRKENNQHYLDDASVDAFKQRQGDHVHLQPLTYRARRRQAAVARMHRGLKPMRFVSLHHHSTFSFLDGFQMPDVHVRRATEIQMGAMAMTEHGNIFSHVKLEKACEGSGVKPIFGCEVYMGWTDDKRKTQKKNHLTVVARNETGYHNLLKLVSRSWAEGFYYEPTVDPRWLVEHKEGLVILSGCLGSALATAMIGGKHVPEDKASYRRGRRVAKWFKDRFGDAYFLEVQAFPELQQTRTLNPMMEQCGKDLGIPLVATMDVHYTAPEEQEIQKILHNVRPGSKKTLEEQVRDWGYDVPLCVPPTDKVIYRRLRETGLSESAAIEAIVSTEEIAQDCNVVLPRQPRVQYPTKDPHALWEKWLREGWDYRGMRDLPAAERDRYRKQLAHEKDMIERKDYVGYFLIVADAVKWAKNNGVPVGPARGSAAGSLVSYLLRITEVNPLLFPLLQFERFIDETRQDMPDIDLDFAPSGLPRLREYMEGKYGEGCVNSVGTFTMYRSKNSLDDVGKVHHIPKFEVEKVKDLLLWRSMGDLRKSSTALDTMQQFDEARAVAEAYPKILHAADLEGNARGFGIHAAGLVVSNAPITNITAVLERVVDGELRRVVAVDKYDAERQGMEKLDFLSLSTMEMIADYMHHTGMTVEDLYAIPLDDQATIDGFLENDVTGVFQYDGRTTRFVAGILKPHDFTEVAIGVALSRPGPMLNGASQSYIAVKQGAEPEYLHPAFETITKRTRGQVIFQEQILAIVRDVGGFDHTHRSQIRRIMSKKRGEAAFNAEWVRFRDGARRLHDMDDDTAKAIWNICITAGSYAFNAAHSWSYGMLAWWCMYMKRHNPAQFYASGLAKLPEGQDKERHEALKRDAHRNGIALLPPGDRAGVSWQAADPRTLVAGWREVPGIGEKTAEKLVAYDGDDITEVSGVGPKTADTIRQFQQSDDPFGVRRMERAVQTCTAAVKEAGLPMPTHTASEALGAPGDMSCVLMLMPIRRNLRELFEVHRARFGEELDPKTVHNYDPNRTEWVLMAARDDTDSLQLIFSRKSYPKFKKAIWDLRLNRDIVLVEAYKMGGTKDGDSKGWGGNSGIFHVNKMWVIDPEED